MKKKVYTFCQKLLYGANNNETVNNKQDGSAIVIALLAMMLLMGFVALAVSRTSNETIASSNDTEETKAFEAAQASLELMTHNFDKIFDVKLRPDTSDLEGTDGVEGKKPTSFTTEYDFNQDIKPTRDAEQVVMTGQQFQGLHALRDEWQIDTTATNKYSGVEVALRRKFFNNLIPIFQFGIFYEDDLEFHPGPVFNFGGRVHSNQHIFMKAGNTLSFSSKVTATGHIFTDIKRNGNSAGNYSNKIRIKNAAGNYVWLNYDMGSVRSTGTGTPEVNEPDMPVAYRNPSWAANEVLFQGNLLAEQSRLDLPLRISSQLSGGGLDYIELIKRGRNLGDLFNDGTGTASSPDIVGVTNANKDAIITAQERYYNKTGMRISLADSKAKLPGCATTGGGAVTGDCGVRLDGKEDGSGDNSNVDGSRGYQPKTMSDGYKATRLNGERFYRGSSVETWIKIETTMWDHATNAVANVDITQEILSLGVTEPAELINEILFTKFAIDDSSYYNNNIDTRSIVKLQRFIFKGGVVQSNSDFISNGKWNLVDYNFVIPEDDNGDVDDGTYGDFTGDHSAHMKDAIVAGYTDPKIVPFPIKMYDSREGIYHDNNVTSGSVGSNNVTKAGVMSLVDIDVSNFKKFLNGDFDSKMPVGTPFHTANGRKLKASDIPVANGWVIYISDRRGDFDFDGEYDMEDVYGNNDEVLQPGEDVNNDGVLQTASNSQGEAPEYSETIPKGVAATLDHRYYRRGIRLMNGQTLPGTYDSATPSNTKGFSVASENGVYTLGNYNASGISSVGTPSPSTVYQPQDTIDHIPASIAADAVSILSNKWTDANSFKNAFNLNSRTANETTVRFALMSGDSRTSLVEAGEPDQGGSDKQLAGGVHNFKRFLEKWSGKRLNYSGSLINLYNSRNNNATFKCCNKTYKPPTRNWVFESSFLDPNRIPPGTPYFQTIQLTGFQRVN